MASRETRRLTCLERLTRVCGGIQSEAARRLGVTRQMVSEWKRKGYIPAIYALAVEEASGGAVLAKQVVQEALQVRGHRAGKREKV